ncbi:L-lactate dehydrogenase [Inconstantimicrobium mannanitabidum]|uniref:L-lactate dehydrogenase 3 n=1 Tax=Inconstantimicrobium mannanitabidum TaxID=1604901 RepID=A0ACB5RG64_9CLOT|nr:L-lactate dehydrogenase [Clostridium sp. TW13]GKX68080.1 L-lactate dehydrogenase 3 [Clostridium sp. TW13]
MLVNKLRKVAVVGTGLVGSSTAFSLANQCVCEEIILIDINKERAFGEVLDISHGVEYFSSRTQIKTGEYKDCEDVDVVVITAGAPPRAGQTRLDTLEMSAKVVESIINPIMDSGFNGIFVMISNPVDIITYHVWKLSGLPRNKVIGTGTSLDSARLKSLLSEQLGVDPRSIQAYSMGEHGDSQMVPWSHVYVGGKPFSKIREENPDTYGALDLDALVLKTANLGWDVVNRKGTTYYGIASAAVGIIKSILHNEKRVIPVSTIIEGVYNQDKPIAISVPAIIGIDGVEDVVVIDMTKEEEEKFDKSAKVIRDYISKLGY